MSTDDGYESSIFCGASTGLLKTINLAKRSAANHYGPNELEKNQEIEKMILEDRKLLCGMKNGGIKIFDGTTKEFQFPVRIANPENSWKGLHSHNGKLIGVSESGIVQTWRVDKILNMADNNNSEFKNGNPKAFDSSEKVKSESTIEVSGGEGVKCSASKGNLVALGGDNVQLQMFDLNSPEKGPVFKAKNCRPDKLQLHIPIHFTSLSLPSNTEGIVCTAYGSLTNQAHEVRLYDPRATQRRPVKRIEWERHPIISSCSLDPDCHRLALGNTRGKMAVLDFRQEKRVRPLKGAAGSIRSISSHPDHPEIIAAVGLDRHLHIFDTKTCTRKQKIYLKSPLNSVLIEPGAALEKVDEKKDEIEEEDDDERISDKENENIWNELDKANDS